MPRGRRRRAAPDPIDVAVGANLRRLRRRRGLSQAQLGAPLDLTFQQIQKYEKGTNRVSASMLVRIANLLGVPIGALFDGIATDPAPSPSVAELNDPAVREMLGCLLAIEDPTLRRTLRLHLTALMETAAPESRAPGRSGR
ncbi:MAG TPA: helix-turn-helix transcriptional regulator [Alphaproteobacteria bacterium]|nr:helix-turn-helix transcriptional regulator [Alphaproteobacteria bacterium]